VGRATCRELEGARGLRAERSGMGRVGEEKKLILL
jgi:hypothetical protein